VLVDFSLDCTIGLTVNCSFGQRNSTKVVQEGKAVTVTQLFNDIGPLIGVQLHCDLGPKK
jgi:hypothetical protein